MPQYPLTERQKELLRVLAPGLKDNSVGTDVMFVAFIGGNNEVSFEGPSKKPFKPDIWQASKQSDLDKFVELGFFRAGGSNSYTLDEYRIIEAVGNNFEKPVEPVFNNPTENLKGEKVSGEISVPIPSGIRESLSRFLNDHPEPSKTAFIMMRFSESEAHREITRVIKETLTAFGIEGLRADDKEYHHDLFSNVLTYMHGCGFGIAVFESIERDEFNPNVSLEVGYLMALGKPVCFLKDTNLKTLPVDLIGKLYKEFDPKNISSSIPNRLEKWLSDNGFIQQSATSPLKDTDRPQPNHRKELNDLLAELRTATSRYISFARSNQTNSEKHAELIRNAQEICNRAAFFDSVCPQECLDCPTEPNADQVQFERLNQKCQNYLRYIAIKRLTTSLVTKAVNPLECAVWGEYKERNEAGLNDAIARIEQIMKEVN